MALTWLTENECDVLRREHDAEVTRLREAHESHNTIAALEYRSAIDSMNQRLQKAEHNRQIQLNELKDKHKNEVIAMQRERDSDTRGMVAAQDQSASNYKKKLNRLSEEILAKEALHDAEKSRMNTQFLDEKRKLADLVAMKANRIERRGESGERSERVERRRERDDYDDVPRRRRERDDYDDVLRRRREADDYDDALRRRREAEDYIDALPRRREANDYDDALRRRREAEDYDDVPRRRRERG
jgi:hypothetical protein